MLRLGVDRLGGVGGGTPVEHMYQQKKMYDCATPMLGGTIGLVEDWNGG